jgi:LCP family protein required for cell wall assembly
MTKSPTDDKYSEADGHEEGWFEEDDFAVESTHEAAGEDAVESATPAKLFVAIPPEPDAHEDGLIRRKKRRKKKLKIRKSILIPFVIVAVLVLLGIGGAVAYYIGQKNLHTVSNALIESPDIAVSYAEGKKIQYNGHVYELNENMISILIIGYDSKNTTSANEASSQADALAVVAMDDKTGAVSVIAIPRDSMVDVDIYGDDDTYTGTRTMQLCLAFFYGDGGVSSCQNVSKSVSRILYNIPVNYYFALDETGVGALADRLGGVSLTPLETIPGTSIVEGNPVILFGDEALRYVQYRNTSVLTSSLSRQARQSQFINAFASQTLSSAKGNVTKLISLYNTANEYSLTNLGASEFTFLATSLIRNGINDVDVTTLAGEMTMGDKYAEYNLDVDATYQTILDVYYTQVS